MTPFDPVALLVMLLTFYPVVSVAALQRALRERPEYFAAGVLVSTSGEKLQLPDGRVFDLIFDVDGVSGGPRWQVIEAFPGDATDPFPLERGPLVPIDIDGILPPAPEPTFAALMGQALGELGATEPIIDSAIRDLVAAGDDGGLDAEYDDTIGPAAATLTGDVVELEQLRVTELLEQSEGVEREVDDSEGDFPPLPSDAPEPPPVDLGPPPGPEEPEPPPPEV